MIEKWLKLYYNERIYLEREVLTMENLVVSVFNTESEAYQSFADLKAFRQTQTTRLLKSPWSKNENGHIVEKERYDFEDSTTDAT